MKKINFGILLYFVILLLIPFVLPEYPFWKGFSLGGFVTLVIFYIVALIQKEM